MPVSLRRVENASKSLEEAGVLFKEDPYSQTGRVRLIEGARGILGGTSSLLLVFDQSEVRKIIAQCKKFLSYLDVTEVIETMDDLVQVRTIIFSLRNKLIKIFFSQSSSSRMLPHV